jgi:hypothetical protein
VRAYTSRSAEAAQSPSWENEPSAPYVTRLTSEPFVYQTARFHPRPLQARGDATIAVCTPPTQYRASPDRVAPSHASIAESTSSPKCSWKRGRPASNGSAWCWRSTATLHRRRGSGTVTMT